MALLGLPLFACSSSEGKDVQFLTAALSLDRLDSQVILSIPLNGCSGCAQESIAFSRENFDKQGFYISLIGDDKKEAIYYKKEYFSNQKNVIALDLEEALANEINVQFPSYYFISKSGTEKTVINAQTLQESLSRIKNKLE
ncbi:MAG: hypothetical protein Roseis2KO_04880 [Roseivirga sp.]